ncbi:TetR family transcriptional regulator [Streptomyces sp. NPDC026672]|uniref:TetR/AcrR family transcriptional regulator n=1 Tax=unclassified Streptomyces TaxID=2593676 RepID=UPI0033F2ADCC
MTANQTKRRRDAEGSRERLLKAAAELFADRGYDQTTAREIGERAEVDPTMIARYFGGKAQLYIAVLHAERGVDPASDFLDPAHLTYLAEKATHQGPGPIYQVAVGPFGDAAADRAAREELHHRIVDPVRRRLDAQGVQHAQLRAELLTAALIGVFLARGTDTLPALKAAPLHELLPLLNTLVGAQDQ